MGCGHWTSGNTKAAAQHTLRCHARAMTAFAKSWRRECVSRNNDLNDADRLPEKETRRAPHGKGVRSFVRKGGPRGAAGATLRRGYLFLLRAANSPGRVSRRRVGRAPLRARAAHIVQLGTVSLVDQRWPRPPIVGMRFLRITLAGKLSEELLSISRRCVSADQASSLKGKIERNGATQRELREHAGCSGRSPGDRNTWSDSQYRDFVTGEVSRKQVIVPQYGREFVAERSASKAPIVNPDAKIFDVLIVGQVGYLPSR
jgi:hypothetical protein